MRSPDQRRDRRGGDVLHRLIERALLTVTDRDQSQPNYALMRDLLELTAFVEAELPALCARWREHRKNASPMQAAADGDRSPLHTGGMT